MALCLSPGLPVKRDETRMSWGSHWVTPTYVHILLLVFEIILSPCVASEVSR